MRSTLHGRGILALAAGILALASSPAAHAQVLKILTLNFNSEIVAFDDRSEYMRDLRFSSIVDWIYQYQPDIILLQEAWNYHNYPSIAIPLADAIGYDYFYRIGEGFPGFLWDSDVVLARKELHLQNTQKIELPHSAWHIGNETTWIIPFGKLTNAVGGRLTLANGEPLYVYSTHLLGNSDSDRADQLRALNSAIQAQAAGDGVVWDQANAIVGGDLNSGAADSDLFTLRAAGYADTWAEAHPDHALDDAGVTSCGNPYSPHFNPMDLGAGLLPSQNTIGGDGRIDFVFAHGPRVKTLASTVVFTHPFNRFWMSDHYGVFSTIQIGDDDPPPVANPITDSDELPPVDNTRVLEIGDQDFDPCSDQVDCELNLPDQEVGSKGFALVNRSSDTITAEIDGPMTALPSRNTRLDGNQASSFVFIIPGDYTISIYDSEGDLLQGTIHVRY